MAMRLAAQHDTELALLRAEAAENVAGHTVARHDVIPEAAQGVGGSSHVGSFADKVEKEKIQPSGKWVAY